MNLVLKLCVNLGCFLALCSVFAKEDSNTANESSGPSYLLNMLQDLSVDNRNTSLYVKDVVQNVINTTFNIFGKISHSDLGNEDIYLNVTELLRKNGYKVEEYEVETEDGYILLLIRIRGSGTPIFLMHGIVLSSDDWVTAGPKIGIAYLLAALGYDVWMGNARGNKHSTKHKTLSPDLPAFWDFSYNEIGMFDLPAMIDRTLAVTNQDKLIYIGHSQGTTVFFVMASERPEYDAKVSLMIALAPAGNIAQIKSLVFLFAKVITFNNPQYFFKTLRLAGIQQILPKNIFWKIFTIIICSQEIFQNTICESIADMFAGYDEQQSYPPTRSVVYSHLPAGCATKQFEHYGQTIASRRFAKFDYGKDENLKLYSNNIPPEYRTQNITTPIAFFYGANDLLVDPEDVMYLRNQFSSIIETYKVPFSKFGHLDFLYAKDLKILVFDKMLELIKEYV